MVMKDSLGCRRWLEVVRQILRWSILGPLLAVFIVVFSPVFLIDWLFPGLLEMNDMDPGA
jgi:hypothetical protein